MSFWQNIVESLMSLKSNITRTILTTLGVIFGVGAVIAMMAIGEGAEQEIMTLINSLGARNIHIMQKPFAGTSLKNIIDKTRGLSIDDGHALSREFDFIERYALIRNLSLRLLNLDFDVEKINLIGVQPSYFTIMNLRLFQGRFFFKSEDQRAQQVCLIDLSLAQQLWPNSKRWVGRYLKMNQVWFQVAGIIDDRKASVSSRFESDETTREFNSNGQRILIPITTSLAKVSPKSTFAEIHHIIVQVPTLELTGTYKKILARSLKRRHNGIVDFTIVAPEELLAQKRQTQQIFNIVLLAISAISLIVGGIGIMNIMLANILERIKEIGIRRSMGARKKDILNQFLVESVVICSVGGIAGVFIGYAIAFGISLYTGWMIAVSLKIIAISFSISLIIGLTFGLMPARRAASINPIDALRDH